jgi:hypothetical protein
VGPVSEVDSPLLARFLPSPELVAGITDLRQFWTRMMKMIAWNIAQRPPAWRWLVDSDADIALLQEAKEPSADIAAKINVDAAAWPLPPRPSH